MTAPERIWARPDYNECWRKRLEEEDVEYTRTDLIQPMIDAAVAARLEEAAGACDHYAEQSNNPMNFAENCAIAIHLLITKDEADALEEVRRQARVEGMREALNVLDKLPEYGSPDVNIGVSNAWSAIAAMIAREGGE